MWFFKIYWYWYWIADKSVQINKIDVYVCILILNFTGYICKCIQKINFSLYVPANPWNSRTYFDGTFTDWCFKEFILLCYTLIQYKLFYNKIKSNEIVNNFRMKSNKIHEVQLSQKIKRHENLSRRFRVSVGEPPFGTNHVRKKLAYDMQCQCRPRLWAIRLRCQHIIIF